MKNFKIIELMELFDEGEVIPASQMQRPQSALDREMFEDANRRFNQQANGGRIGFSNGGSEDYIYTRPSGAKRLVIGDTIYGSVAKGDEEGLKALKKKRDKLIKTLPNLRKQYDLESLKKEWRNTLSTKKAVNWEKFLKTKFPKDSTTPDAIRKKTEADFRNDISDFNPKEEFKIKVKQKQNLEKVKLAKKLVDTHNNSEKFLYDKKTIYKKLGFTNVPQIEKIDAKTGTVRKSLFNEAIVNEVNKLVPVKQKVKNAFDKILNEDIKIYEPKGGTKDQGGIIKKMISDIISPKGGPERYQVSVRLINNALNEHQPYLDIKDNFDYLDFKLAKKMKGNTLNEALDYAKYVRGGLEMKNIEKLTNRFLLPESNVFKFALRSAFNNYKAGNTDAPVRVFNLKADGTPGKEIDFAKLKIDYSTNMRVIDTNKIGFIYNNEFFTKKNLRTKGRELGFFDEVYNLTAKGNMPVPDPNNPNKNITLNKLLKLNKDKLTIGHNDAKGGVTKLPFSNLRLEGNKINLALYNAYNKIKNKKLRKLVVNKLQGDFGFLKGDDYERAFIEGEKNKAKNIGKKNIALNPLYKQAGQDVIKDLGKDIFKQTKPFQKEALRVAGVKNINENNVQKLLASFSANPKCRVSFGKGNKDGGRIGYANGPANLADCADSGSKRLEKVIKGGIKLGDQEGALARQILKAGRSLGSAFTLSGLFGPGVIAFTAAAEAGLVGYDMLTTGKTFKETIGDSLFNYALGEKTKINPQEELFKRFSGLGYSDEQLGNFANVLNQTNTLNTLLKQDLKVGNLKDQVKTLREQPKDTFLGPDDDLSQTDTAVRAEQKLKDESLNLDNLLTNYRSQPPVGLNMEDTISKQARADRIAGLEQDYLDLIQERGPELTPFAGGGIAGLSGGIDEGPQVESMNSDSQGLQGLMKRARNI
jgi:hypothetical protein